jgi:hypothetical protein
VVAHGIGKDVPAAVNHVSKHIHSRLWSRGGCVPVTNLKGMVTLSSSSAIFAVL